jgi:predicted RNA binding protein YcfA (HicA-like mRNA interferase family)
MPKLGTFSGDELCQILGRNGFTSVRQRGSHVVMQKQTDLTTITVPVPMHREVRIGTLQSIIRQSGLPRSEFENR